MDEEEAEAESESEHQLAEYEYRGQKGKANLNMVRLRWIIKRQVECIYWRGTLPSSQACSFILSFDLPVHIWWYDTIHVNHTTMYICELTICPRLHVPNFSILFMTKVLDIHSCICWFSTEHCRTCRSNTRGVHQCRNSWSSGCHSSCDCLCCHSDRLAAVIIGNV